MDITLLFSVHPMGGETKDNQHKLIQRFVPKNKRLADIFDTIILQVQQWINNIPQKTQGYRIKREVFYTRRDIFNKFFQNEKCLVTRKN